MRHCPQGREQNGPGHLSSNYPADSGDKWVAVVLSHQVLESYTRQEESQRTSGQPRKRFPIIGNILLEAKCWVIGPLSGFSSLISHQHSVFCFYSSKKENLDPSNAPALRGHFCLVHIQGRWEVTAPLPTLFSIHQEEKGGQSPESMHTNIQGVSGSV